MKKFVIPATFIIACLYGCGPNQDPDTERNGLPGSDVDEHGCIGSAGYQWCGRTSQCERPWELAEKEGFENTRDEFHAFCSGQ